MRRIVHVLAGAGLAAAVGAGAPLAVGTAGAQGPPSEGPSAVVFVQNDNPAGNQVVAYDRAPTGTLSLSAVYPTGGDGGVLQGSAVDHLASQGSLQYDAADHLLYAVNAGSNTVSVFSVSGDSLALRQIVPSGGTFPNSIAVRGDLVYVLNARDGGSVSGYRAAGGTLHRIEGSVRGLGLTTPTDTTEFTHTPGQVAFSPDGRQLLVTTKAASTSVDVFSVTPSGRLSAAPVVNQEPTTVPFAISFDAAGRALVVEAGPNAVADFTLGADGSLTPVASLATGQAASCWIASAQGVFFVSNAGSATLSGVAEATTGGLSLIGNTSTDKGTVDAAPSAGGQFLYVQTGLSGTVDEFQVTSDGSLNEIGSVAVPNGAGGEGIVAF